MASTKLDADQVLKRSYDEDNNRIRVDAEVTASIGTVDVVIDASTGDNIAIADQSGTNFLTVNPDGTIPVEVTDITLDQGNDSIAIGDGTTLVSVDPATKALLVEIDSSNTQIIFNEITSVASGITSTIASYTALTNTKLVQISVAGTNIARYSIYIGGILRERKYTYFQSLNETFTFGVGLDVNMGDLISVQVLHDRTDLGDFNASILVRN